MENTSLIDPSGCGIAKNNQGAYVSKNEAYLLVKTVQAMFDANEIEYEVQQTVCKKKIPETCVKIRPTGIKIKLGFTWKNIMVTKLIPRGGIFDE